MDFLKKNKMAIGVGVLLLAAIYVYMTFFSGPPAATLSSSDAETALSQNLLTTLQSLHTIQLNDAIFTDPAFLSLTDFGVTIPPENVGRGDPFAPLGASTGSSAGGPVLPPIAPTH